MFHCVKGFSKIQLKDQNFFLRLMTLMYVLKGPGNAVLNCSTPNETILIDMDEFQDDELQPICKEFSQELDAAVQKGNWSEIIDRLWSAGFRH